MLINRLSFTVHTYIFKYIYIYTFISICSHSFLNGDGTFLTANISWPREASFLAESFGRRKLWPLELLDLSDPECLGWSVREAFRSFNRWVEFPGSPLGWGFRLVRPSMFGDFSTSQLGKNGLKQLPSWELIYPLARHYLKMMFLFPRWYMSMLVPWEITRPLGGWFLQKKGGQDVFFAKLMS